MDNSSCGIHKKVTGDNRMTMRKKMAIALAAPPFAEAAEQAALAFAKLENVVIVIPF